MSRLTLALVFALRTALPRGLGMPWLVLTLALVYPHGMTPPGWDGAAAAEESRPRALPSARGLFRRHCLRCHDADGAGQDVRVGRSEAPDFTNPRWQQQRSTAQLVVSILEGKGNRMPAFAGKITTEQARDLAALVRSFAPPPAQTAPGAEDDFDKRFRELQEEFERLRKQLDEVSPRTSRAGETKPKSRKGQPGTAPPPR
jgi:mono/diheme cytochrome c family protein